MTFLNSLLREVGDHETVDNTNIAINDIQFDSRKVVPGDLFVAIKGGNFDGHNFIQEAVKRGASAVMGENDNFISEVPYIRVPNSRKAFSSLVSAFYGHPGKNMDMIGITGTNGKTSTALLIDSILQQNNRKTGLLGSIMYKTGEHIYPSQLTTPESKTLHNLLSEMYQSGIESVVMEISSHALEQYRVGGIEFRVAIFTNLSQDHLDYHTTMEEYAEAKQILFRQLDPENGFNVVNADDAYHKGMTSQNTRPVISFSMDNSEADVYPESVEFLISGIQAQLQTPLGKMTIDSKLIGRHNLQNIMAAIASGISLDVPLQDIEAGISKLDKIPGRLECVDNGQSFHVFVDFAHTPDAMEKAIESVKPLVKGKLIVLFGCGGDRDKGKRPLMGQIAENGADIAILTSDNPRTEDPQQIIDDVLAGITNKSMIESIVSRKEAIKKAVSIASGSDCVLLLGKGHETYQEVGSEKLTFDDRVIASECIAEKLGAALNNNEGTHGGFSIKRPSVN